MKLNQVRTHYTIDLNTHSFIGAILQCSMMLMWTINHLRTISCSSLFVLHITFHF